jgi:hypothetical protein
VPRLELYTWVNKDIAHVTKSDGMRMKAIMARMGFRPMTVIGWKSGKPEQGYGEP